MLRSRIFTICLDCAMYNEKWRSHFMFFSDDTEVERQGEKGRERVLIVGGIVFFMKLETGRGGGAGVLLAMVAYYGLYNIF